MDIFKDNNTLGKNTLKKLCAEKFQPLDLSVNKAVKSFIQNKYSDWFADQVFTQL